MSALRPDNRSNGLLAILPGNGSILIDLSLECLSDLLQSVMFLFFMMFFLFIMMEGSLQLLGVNCARVVDVNSVEGMLHHLHVLVWDFEVLGSGPVFQSLMNLMPADGSVLGELTLNPVLDIFWSWELNILNSVHGCVHLGLVNRIIIVGVNLVEVILKLIPSFIWE